MLEQVLKDLAHEICLRQGYSDNFDIILTLDLEDDVAITIVGGSVPIIYINRVWVLNTLFSPKPNVRAERLAIFDFKMKLSKALEKVPKMTRSLALLTVREAISLKKEARKWVLDTVPQMRNHLRDKFFEVSYSVTVTVKETTTNTVVTRTISDPDNIKSTISDIKASISRSIISNEEMLEIRSIAENLNSNSSLIIPAKIHISTQDGIKETNEY